MTSPAARTTTQLLLPSLLVLASCSEDPPLVGVEPPECAEPMEVARVAPVCSRDGWCWDGPRPVGAEYRVMASRSPGDAWLGGVGGGYVVHVHCNDWRLIETGSEGDAVAMWDDGARPWLFTSGGERLRFDPAGTPEAMFHVEVSDAAQAGPGAYFAYAASGTGTGDLWLSVADRSANVGTLHHFDGTKWSTGGGAGAGAPASRVTSLAAVGPSDVWAVTLNSKVLRFDGRSWFAEPAAELAGVTSVLGFGPDDLWFLPRAQSAVVRRDAGGYRRVALPTLATAPLPLDAYAMWGTGSRDLFVQSKNRAVVVRYDGERWQALEQELGDASASVGAFTGPARHHWNGDARSFDALAVGDDTSPVDVWQAPGGDFWIAGAIDGEFPDNGVIHYDATGRWAQRTSAGALWSRKIAGAPTGEVWVLGERGVAASVRGGPFGPVAEAGHSWSDLWVGGANDVWLVGESLMHFDGTNFQRFSLGGEPWFLSVWGSGAGDLWLLAESGRVYRRRPGAMEPFLEVPAAALDPGLGDVRGAQLFGVGADDVWLAVTVSVDESSQTVFEHFVGGRFQVVETFGGSVFRVRARGGNDVWFLGAAALHWDGVHLTDTHVALGLAALPRPRDVVPLGDKDAWLVGDDGFIAHWDGAAWTPRSSGTRQPLLHVLRVGGDLMALGAAGTLLRHRL